MNHSFYKDRISAFHDKELKREEELMIAEHLKECEECRKLLEELEKFDRVVESHSGLKDDEYWEQAAQRVEHAIETGGKTKITGIRPSSWKGLKWKLVGVAASLVIIASIALYQRDIPDEVKKITAPAPLPELREPLKVESTKTEALRRKHVPARARGEKERREVAGEALEAIEPGEATLGSRMSAGEPGAPADEKEGATLPVVRERHRKKRLAIPDEAVGVAVTVEGADFEAKAPPRTMADQDVVVKSQPAPVAAPKDEPVEPDEETAGAGVEYLSDSAFQVTLDQWRQKRDSLSRSLSRFRALTLKGATGVKAVQDKARSPETQVQREKLLLECYYHIALLTDDEHEYQAAVEYLRGIAGKEQPELSKVARDYLERLNAEK